MTSTNSQQNSNNDPERPNASISGILADDDNVHTGSTDQPGKINSPENESGDSGVSLSNDNNVLSSVLSTPSQFPDNSILPHNSGYADVFDRSQTSLRTPTQSMDDSLGPRADNKSGRMPLGSEEANRNMQRQMEWMKKNLELLKQENASLQNALTNSGIDVWRDPRTSGSSSRAMSSNPTFLLSSFKMEMASFKAELSRIKSSLESCELGRKTFSERWSTSVGSSLEQMNRSLKEMLLRNLENPVNKVLMSSLEGRLKSTEDRLKRSRTEVNDSISKVEERLLLENVDLKMSEVEAKRKFQQSADRIEAMRKNHQTLMEVYQRLKVRSSENGFIDLQEILKRLSVDESEAKLSGRKEETMSTDAMQEIKDDVVKQVSIVVAEKQRLSSELMEASEEMELAKKENDGLKRKLNELNSKWDANMADFRDTQISTIERLLKQMETFSSEASQLCRCDDGASSTIRVLEDVLDTKERLLSSTLAELEKLMSSRENLQAKVEPPKQNSDQLSAIFDFMRFKAGDAMSASPQPTQESSSSNAASQGELARLTAKCSKLEHDLEFNERNLDFQKEEVESLQAQLNTCRDNLRQTTQQLDMSTSNESDLRRELKMHREWLDGLNVQLLETEKQLKLLELDKGSVQRLFEKDGANMEMNEGNDADVKFIKQALELDLMSSRNALDTSLKENLQLKQTLEQAARDLAAERDVTSTSTYDKLILQQELYMARQEKDELLKERDDMKRNISLLQLENQKLSSSLSKGHDLEPDSHLQEKIKNLTAELQDTKMKLEAKERDTAFFQDTLKFVLKSNEEHQAKKS